MCESDYIAYRTFPFSRECRQDLLSGAVHCRETPPKRDTLF